MKIQVQPAVCSCKRPCSCYCCCCSSFLAIIVKLTTMCIPLHQLYGGQSLPMLLPIILKQSVAVGYLSHALNISSHGTLIQQLLALLEPGVHGLDMLKDLVVL